MYVCEAPGPPAIRSTGSPIPSSSCHSFALGKTRQRARDLGLGRGAMVWPFHRHGESTLGERVCRRPASPERSGGRNGLICNSLDAASPCGIADERCPDIAPISDVRSTAPTPHPESVRLSGVRCLKYAHPSGEADGSGRQAHRQARPTLARAGRTDMPELRRGTRGTQLQVDLQLRLLRLLLGLPLKALPWPGRAACAR